VHVASGKSGAGGELHEIAARASRFHDWLRHPFVAGAADPLPKSVSRAAT
jgi:hypothetical protein